MMPEPTTAMTRISVPSASAASRRVRSNCTFPPPYPSPSAAAAARFRRRRGAGGERDRRAAAGKDAVMRGEIADEVEMRLKPGVRQHAPGVAADGEHLAALAP